MSERDTPGRLVRYQTALDGLMGRPSMVYDLSPEPAEPGRMLAITYTNTDDGLVTSFTYGLSLSEHESWDAVRPELCIAVRIGNPGWGEAVARMAGSLRGRCPFFLGQVVSHIEPLVANSGMNCLLMAEPAIAPRGEGIRIGLSEGTVEREDVVEIVGAYPVYASERDFIYANGVDAFWRLGVNNYDPLRVPGA